jgi:hypothetical protein
MGSTVPRHEPGGQGVRVSNVSGTLRVWVSECGLPVRVQIAPSLLTRGSDALAREIVRLCRDALR